MKKTIIALCTVMIIFACNLLTSVPVCAEERNCGHNSYVSGAYLDPNSIYYTYSTHPYKIGDGITGPIYGTCHISTCHGVKYPQCSICGDVDYNHPQECWLYVQHENCGMGIIPY